MSEEDAAARHFTLIAIAVAAGVGVASWFAISWQFDETEAWDAQPYFPIMIGVAGALGLLVGRAPWWIGLTLAATHFVVLLLVIREFSQFLPVAVVFTGIDAAIFGAAAWAGVWLQRKAFALARPRP